MMLYYLMEILEKFKKYKIVFVSYLRLRFNPLRYIILSLLMMMLSISNISSLISYSFLNDFTIIFVSLFIFRFIDDLASYRFDRNNNPERTYLSTDNIKVFVILTLLLFVIYMFANYLWCDNWNILLIFTIFISVLYSIFINSKYAVTIIQIFKYPFLLYYIQNSSVNIELILIFIGSYALMLSNDIFENYSQRLNSKNFKLIAHYLMLSIIGMLIMQPFNYEQAILLFLIILILPIPLIYFKRFDKLNELPIVIYPLFKLTIMMVFL